MSTRFYPSPEFAATGWRLENSISLLSIFQGSAKLVGWENTLPGRPMRKLGKCALKYEIDNHVGMGVVDSDFPVNTILPESRGLFRLKQQPHGTPIGARMNFVPLRIVAMKMEDCIHWESFYEHSRLS
jgi:hypothetical protein